MNILIVGPYPPPYGGISSLIRSLVEGFKEKDVGEVIILYFGSKNEIRMVEGATVYEKSVLKSSWQILNPINWILIPALLNIYSGNNFSIKDFLNIFIRTILTNNIKRKHDINVSSFYQSDTSFHLLLCKKIWKKNVSIVLTVFGEIYDVSEYLMPKKNLLLEMLYKSDTVISSSCYCADSFSMIGNEREIEVIYVGVSASRFSNLKPLRESYRKELGINESTIILLFMGRFSKEMGLHSIIEMYPSLRDANTDFHLILAGASGELINSANELNKEFSGEITILNDIPFDLQPSLYAASDIVLAPSRDKHACMGVSIKEAMVASRPVIASDSGGIPEAVLHNETGIIVPLLPSGENDLEKFKQAILDLSANDNKRKYLAENSLQRARDIFSEEETINKTLEVFMRHDSR